MSLSYVLDGYNIVKQIPALALKGLKNGRESLVSIIEIYHPQGSRQNKVTIVFDGKPGIVYGEIAPPSATVRVVFTEDESADDKIRRMITISNRKKQIVVVTDDKELRFSVRALGAGVLGVKEFLSKIKRPQTSGSASKTKNNSEEDEKHISKTLEYKITSEFERIWLNK